MHARGRNLQLSQRSVRSQARHRLAACVKRSQPDHSPASRRAVGGVKIEADVMDAIAARRARTAFLIRSSKHRFPGCRQMRIRELRLQSDRRAYIQSCSFRLTLKTTSTLFPEACDLIVRLFNVECTTGHHRLRLCSSRHVGRISSACCESSSRYPWQWVGGRLGTSIQSGKAKQRLKTSHDPAGYLRTRLVVSARSPCEGFRFVTRQRYLRNMKVTEDSGAAGGVWAPARSELCAVCYRSQPRSTVSDAGISSHGNRSNVRVVD